MTQIRRNRTALLCLLLAGCAAVPHSPSRPVAGAPAAVAGTIQAAQADATDPVAARLAIYLRLLQPGGGSAQEIAGFLAANPTWPNRALLTQRIDQAIAAETDQTALGALCGNASLSSGAPLARCAGLPEATAPAATRSPALVAAARQAWIAGIDQPDQAAAFLRQWGDVLTPADQWRRFDRQEWAGAMQAAGRTLPLLSPSDRPAAQARIALRLNQPDADRIAAALPDPAAQDPTLLLERARFLRRADRLDEALSLWRGALAVAEPRIVPGRLLAMWSERDALSRSLLATHRDAEALLVADDAAQTDAAARLDSSFLCGWIALRRLGDPAGAERDFAPLLASPSAITRSRGLYWTGRARLARGDGTGADAMFRQAAALPTTFYGQLAAARLQPAPGTATLLDPGSDPGDLSDRIARLDEPRWTQDQAIAFAGLELARAAELLVSWNDPHHARAFLLRLDQLSTSDSDHAMAASLADRLGLPDVAVAIARAAGRHGLVLARSGWPRPVSPPAGGGLPPGLALSVIRQESSFDPQIVSPAGAHGLMQLTAGTARDTAHAIGRPDLSGGVALSDPEANMILGCAYLAGLLQRFGGVVPYALAAYNAGPHRVDTWLASQGDRARSGTPGQDAQEAMIDWIESIPFAETRNYVERVVEGMAVYRAGAAPA